MRYLIIIIFTLFFNSVKSQVSDGFVILRYPISSYKKYNFNWTYKYEPIKNNYYKFNKVNNNLTKNRYYYHTFYYRHTSIKLKY